MDVVPERLAELAGTFQRTAESTRRAWTSSSPELTVPADAAGNSAQGPRLVAAHTATVDAGDLALGRLASVLEQDMDDLYACAFDVATTDEKQAESYRSDLPRIGPFPLHPTIDWSVYDR